MFQPYALSSYALNCALLSLIASLQTRDLREAVAALGGQPWSAEGCARAFQKFRDARLADEE